MGKRELVALLNLSSWCLVLVERLFLAVPRGCLRFVIVVFPDHTHLLFLLQNRKGSLTVWALSAYFSESPSFCYGACSISTIGESNDKASLQNIFKILTPLRVMAGRKGKGSEIS